jgi:hypothetical protein
MNRFFVTYFVYFSKLNIIAIYFPKKSESIYQTTRLYILKRVPFIITAVRTSSLKNLPLNFVYDVRVTVAQILILRPR